MPHPESIIATNLRRVRERIAQAAETSGRQASDVMLVGVTKYVDAGCAAALAAAGCHELGESRPQELWHKAASIELPDVRWHLVGHLQRNKVRQTLPLVKLVHSVDSQRLLKAIDDQASQSGPADVLLEVNTTGEAAKHGVTPEALPALVESATDFTHIHIRGLMTMATLEGGKSVARRDFASLRELRDRVITNAPECVHLDELSMGMSGDFEVAIEEGATIVRIGSLLWQGVELPT